MRHNQNGRRFRGRGSGHNNGGHNNGGGNRRINPRVQTFDSNGPDVRIRGNAIQINEKYLALARDAQAAGDRVLAESYFQHAEHYQRMLNEAQEEQQRHQAQQQQQQQQQQPVVNGDAFVQEGVRPDAEGAAGAQPSDDGLADLDQGFLVGKRGGEQGKEGETTPAGSRRRRGYQQKEA